MIFNALKNYWIVIFILTLASCSNINVIKIGQDLKRIDKFNDKGEFVKSYFKKFDKKTGQWLLANCYFYNAKTITLNSAKIITLKNNECEFTNMSLHMIKIAQEDDNMLNSSISDDKNIDTEQEEQNQEQQDNNNEEEEEVFFVWFGDCEEYCDE